MQNDERNQGESEGQEPENRGPQSRRSASESLSCEHCGRPLTGRKERFCSDRCRMRDRRDLEHRRRLELLNTIDAAVEELRIGLGCDDD